jgi:hypothetical protein
MIPIALNIAHLAIAQMHIYSAPTGAHIAGGFFNLIRDFLRGVDLMLSHYRSLHEKRNT